MNLNVALLMFLEKNVILLKMSSKVFYIEILAPVPLGSELLY